MVLTKFDQDDRKIDDLARLSFKRKLYWLNPYRLLVIALFMNRGWRHQFGPEITTEEGCLNVIAVLPCEETIRNMFF